MDERTRHIDLFSGIGGFALAADRVFGNIEHVFCDNEPFAQAVLSHHWPDALIYGDIRELKGDESQPFILTGGFPCQPFSQAGRRQGTADNRYLWPEMFRVIREFKPQWVIAENVGGLVTWNEGMVLEQVCTDLESEGYEVQPFIIPAVSLNAPHRRDRVWIVANCKIGDAGRNIPTVPDTHGKQDRPQEQGQKETRQLGCSDTSTTTFANSKHQSEGHTQRGRNDEGTPVGVARPDTDAPDTESQQTHPAEPTRFHPKPSGENRTRWEQHWPEVAAELCRVDDGIPRRLDRATRLKALGNAIVPQVAEEIMRAIKHSS